MWAPFFMLAVVLGLALRQMPECGRERTATLVECKSMEGIANIGTQLDVVEASLGAAHAPPKISHR